MTTSLTVLAPSALPLLRRDDYDSVIKRFNLFLKGRTANEENIREFFKKEEAPNYSARSIQKHKCAIKAAVYKAFPTHDTRIKAGMDEIFKSIKIPKPDPKVQEEDLFTKQEIRAIVAIAPRHIGFIVKAMYDTGARVSEALSIRLDKCREDARAVRCDITGKGSKERVLVMSRKLFHEIRKHFRGNTWLFEHHGRHYSRQHTWFTVKKWGKKATGRRVHPHLMRHSRITHLLGDKHPLAAVSRFAGHSQVKTTLEFYEHNVLDAKTITGSGLK